MPPEHQSSHGIASSTVERYIRPVAWYYSRAWESLSPMAATGTHLVTPPSA
jgi:hypothetical protein